VKLAHLADVHLGFRQYERLSPAGANLREADVALAFRRAIDGVIAEGVDLVLIAGDFFHQVRPTNAAIIAAYRELARLRQALPNAAVVLISGDHDTPRSSETVPIVGLFHDTLGIDVIHRGVQVLDRAGVTVTCVPQGSLAELAGVHPVPGRLNVLLAHGEARDLPHQARTIGAEVLGDGWDYIALGHYHVHQQVAPRAWYAGSLDYVSTDAWKDLAEQAKAGLPGKGWLSCELPAGAPVFHPIDAPRLVVDLPILNGANQSPADLSTAINELVAAVPDGAVARLKVFDVPRAVSKELDHEMIRSHKGRLTFLHMDLQRPEVEVGPERRARMFVNLDQTVDAHLGAWQLPPDLEPHRADFIKQGMTYFRDAGQKQPTSQVHNSEAA